MIEIGIVLFFFFLAFIGAYTETRQWNAGNHCGKRWIHFDRTSQGCRGYKCGVCGKYIWISYPWIDKG